MRFTKSALKDLRRMDRRYAERLQNALLTYEEKGTGDVKPLVNRPGYRLRLGDYRAIFEIVDEEIVVLGIGPRGGIY